MTQEFHISITPVRDNEYLVRTEQVAPGVPLAEEQLVWPVDEWLAQTRHLMNDPLLGLLRSQTRETNTSDLTSVSSFMELGQQLYQNLFQGILRDSWMTAQGIAQHRGEVLRLRLGLKGTQLPKLPWEVMHGHTRDGLGLTTHPLATGVNLLFSRYQPDRHIARSGMAIAPSKSSVVRVLMVLALPADQDQLELDQEARQLQHELRLQSEHLQEHVVGTLPDIQVSILKHPSRTQLAQALEQSQYQVLHYAGHSDLGSEGGKLYLVDQHGLTETLTGDDLAGLLVNNGIQMAVFNSCRGGHTATGSPQADLSERTLTDALVNRGIPAVLAMAERIPDDVALTLTRFFYRNLKQGYPVDLSLSRARQGLLAAYGSNQLYWALPTLYLHPDFDGYLTAGDRLLDNPADNLSRIPQFNTPSLMDWENEHISDSAPLPQLTPDMGADWEPATMTHGSTTVTDTDLYGFEEPIDSEDAFLLSPEEMAELTNDVSDSTEHRRIARNESTDIGNTSSYTETPSASSVQPETPWPQASGNTNPHGQEGAIQNHSTTTADQDTSALVYQPRNRSQPMTAPPSNLATHPLPNSPDCSRRVGPPRWFYPLAGAAVFAIALVGSRAYGEWMSQSRDTPVVETTGQLVSDAKAKLEEGRLDEASTILDQVDTMALDEPQVLFLQGRLIWEQLKTNSETDLSVEDARQFWEKAVGNDQQPQYYNALGFALYAEGRLNDAVEAWGYALQALEQQGVVVVPEADSGSATSSTDQPIAVPTETISNGDALTAYAGTALALAQLAGASPTVNQQVNLMSKVAKIQQVIRNSDPSMFEPDTLRSNWLWTESAITEWEYLSQIQVQ